MIVLCLRPLISRGVRRYRETLRRQLYHDTSALAGAWITCIVMLTLPKHIVAVKRRLQNRWPEYAV